VARAKRTDRAEARRRYRLTIAADEATLDEADPTTGTAAIAPAARANRPATPRATTAATAATSRPSLPGALRGAVQPAPIMDDLRAVPQIVLRTKTFIVPAGLSLVSGAAFLITGDQANVIATIAFQAFVVPPPMAASFIGGILAPRAGWAIGGLVGLTAALVFAVVAGLYPDTTAAASGTGGTLAQRQNAILFAFLISPVMGVAVGAFAGFYRRFLRSAGPGQPRSNRQKRASSRR